MMCILAKNMETESNFEVTKKMRQHMSDFLKKSITEPFISPLLTHLLVFPRGQFLLKKVSWLVSDKIVFISFDFEIDGLPKRMNVIMSEGQSTDIFLIISLSSFVSSITIDCKG
jgi:hypothetical protein